MATHSDIPPATSGEESSRADFPSDPADTSIDSENYSGNDSIIEPSADEASTDEILADQVSVEGTFTDDDLADFLRYGALFDISSSEAYSDDDFYDDEEEYYDEDEDDGDDDEDDDDDDSDYDDRVILVQPVCGLCRFQLEYYEHIIHYHHNSESLGYKASQYNEFDFKFGRNGNRAFHGGCLNVYYNAYKRWWNHLEYDPDLENLYDVTGCISDSLEPPQSMIDRRSRWLRDSIAKDLQHALKSRLPQEIYDTIASYCTRERATQLIRDAPLVSGSKLKGFTFDGKDPLWVHYVKIEGLRYVQSLSPRQLSQDDTSLLPADGETGAPFNIYFAEDYRGIREIITTQSDEPPTTHREAGLHWVICCRHQKAPFFLRTKSDVVKLRGLDVTTTERDTPDWNRRRWATFPRYLDTFPHPPSICNGYKRKHDYYEAIQAVDWNSPGVCGYYFYVDDGDLRGIVTIKPQDSPTAHLDEYDKHGRFGIYVPIDSDEQVSELWLRTGKYFYSSHGSVERETLILRTSKGRSHVLGPDIGNAWPGSDKTGLEEFTYTTIATFPQTGPVRMFYSRAGYANAWLAFQKPTLLDVWLGLGQVTTWTGKITALLPAPDYYTSLVQRGNMLTSAPLDGLKSVRACRSWDRCHKGEFTGLLLAYADGSQRCVGQVRPDCLEAPMAVRSDKIWLGASHRPVRCCGSDDWFPGDLIIDCVCMDEPLDRDDYDYLEVPLTGRLDWHAQLWCSAVAHFDSSEGFDEIDEALARATSNTLRESEVKTFDIKIRAEF